MKNIDEMPAGREMDALVVQKIFGHDKFHLCKYSERSHSSRVEEKTLGGVCECGELVNPTWKPIPRYSTDIAAAWEVLGMVESTMLVWSLVQKRLLDHRSVYECSIGFCETGTVAILRGRSEDASAPLAICRAALKAVCA